ncbi:MAG: DUF2085 domain-containing protein [Candidatus Micrarchaeota archaeon]
MERTHLAYGIYVLILSALMGSIVAIPLLSFSQDMRWAYDAFGPTCHQKLSRSLCVFSEGHWYWIADCTPQEGEYVSQIADRESVAVEEGSVVGHKMPVCARDFGLYGAMLLGALAYPLIRRLDEPTLYPAIYLLLAMVPIGLDGGVQLVSELGLLPFVYESSNLMRILTGGIAGFAASFYAIPLIVGFAMARNQRGSSGLGPRRS